MHTQNLLDRRLLSLKRGAHLGPHVAVGEDWCFEQLVSCDVVVAIPHQLHCLHVTLGEPAGEANAIPT